MKSDMRSFKIHTIILVLVQCLMLTACGRQTQVTPEEDESIRQKALRKEAEIGHLGSEEYDSVMMSMWGVPYMEDTKEWIDFYRARDLYVCSEQVDGLEELRDYMEASLASDNEVLTMMLMLDPLKLWQDIGSDAIAEELDDKLVRYITDNEGIVFEMMMPWYYNGIRPELTEEEMSGSLEVVRQLAELTASCGNVRFFSLQDQDWIVDNPGNFCDEDKLLLHNSVYKTLLLYTLLTWGDGRFEYTGEELVEHFGHGLVQATELRTTYMQRPDLSGTTVLVLGDSIMGSFRDSLGAGGVIEALSGAHVVNCAIGGTSAVEAVELELEVLKGGELPVDEVYSDYVEARDLSGDGLVILLEFGTNDYFESYELGSGAHEQDVTTYTGALNCLLQELEELYPGARYYMLAPGIMSMSNWGEEPNKAGNNLASYRRACKELATEKGIPCIDMAADIGVYKSNLKQYIWDELHFSESGRYYLGNKIIEWLSSQMGGGHEE